MEILDLYDRNGNKTEKTIVRGQEIKEKDLHIKVVVIWIKNNDKFLIQKVSKQKGGVWAVTGGHIKSGASSLQTCTEELFEELGLKVKEQDLKYLGLMNELDTLFDIFLLECKLNEDQFILQKEEVESVKWLSKSQIEDLIKNNIFRPSSKMHYELFIKNNY